MISCRLSFLENFFLRRHFLVYVLYLSIVFIARVHGKMIWFIVVWGVYHYMFAGKLFFWSNVASKGRLEGEWNWMERYLVFYPPACENCTSSALHLCSSRSCFLCSNVAVTQLECDSVFPLASLFANGSPLSDSWIYEETIWLWRARLQMGFCSLGICRLAFRTELWNNQRTL